MKTLACFITLFVSLSFALDKNNEFQVFLINEKQLEVVALKNKTNSCDNVLVIFSPTDKLKEAKTLNYSDIEEWNIKHSARIEELALSKNADELTFLIEAVLRQTNCEGSQKFRRSTSGRRIFGNIFSSNKVYLTTFINKYSGDDRLTRTEADGTKQYFDLANSINEYSWYPEGTAPNPEIFLTGLGTKSSSALLAAKLYWRFSGTISKDYVEKANLNFKNEGFYRNTPSLSEAAYWFVWKPSSIKNPIPIHHEFVEFCMDDGSRFILDRGARETILTNTFNTRVRIIYLGKTSDCNVESNDWVDKEVKDKVKENLGTRQVATLDGTTTLRDIVEFSVAYASKFIKYNTLANCQHFATNFFNLLANLKLDYYSADVMKCHSDKSELEGEKLPFGIDLKKSNQIANTW